MNTGGHNMAYSNGKIFDDVSIDDVNAVLGTDYSTLEDCVRSTSIQKWSRIKPVAHTIKFGSGVESSLTDVEAKGASALISEGVIYGLKAGAADNAWPSLHTCTYDYTGRPDGTNYPNRLADFVGYDHYAKPTLIGSIVSSEIDYQAVNLRVGVLWQDTDNTTGVDVLQLTAGEANINDYYVNVLVDNYAITLLNANTGTRTPIVYNGTKQDLFYINSLPSGYTTTKTASCTFFLSPVQLTSWTDVSKSQQQGPAIAIPEAVGLTLSIKAGFINYGTWSIGEVNVMLGKSVTAGLTCSAAPGAARDYRVVLQFTSQAQATVKTFSVSATTTAELASRIITWASTELGFVVTTSGTYNYSISLYGYDSANNTTQQLATKSGSLTFTVEN